MKTVHRNPRRSEKRQIERKFMSPAEAARLTGVTRQTWSAWAAQGRLVSIKLGKRVLLPVDEVNRLLKEGTRTANSR